MPKMDEQSSVEPEETEETEESLRRYIKELLEPVVPTKQPNGHLSPQGLSRSTSHLSSSEMPAEAPTTDSRSQKTASSSSINDRTQFGESSSAAVEILSRHMTNSRHRRAGGMLFADVSASYDIAKEGTLVAVLSLGKTTYRLSETVMGAIAYNDKNATRQVLRVRSMEVGRSS